MDQDDLRLSRIDTLWSIVRKAHGSPGQDARHAQEMLLTRYGGAVRRYLLGALRNEDSADEVFQEFSLKLVSGAFQRARVDQGRFRSFLKTSLFHLIIDHQRRQRRRGADRPLPPETPDRPPAADDLAKQEEAWTQSWREELLAKSWAALAQAEQTTGTPYHAVLRFRSDHPELRSSEMAEQLGKQLGRSFSPNSVRVLIHRAREMFAERLLDLVIESLNDRSLDTVDEELIELNLLEYCRAALERRRGVAPAKPR
jgi:RNA polymerase sigma-70 factor (ECF subfamily)